MDMIVVDDLSAFLVSRWREDFTPGKKSSKTRIMRVLQAIWGGWRPVGLETNVSKFPWVPTYIVGLIVRCCDHDPGVRPSFNEILSEMNGPAVSELQRNKYMRKWAFPHVEPAIESGSMSVIDEEEGAAKKGLRTEKRVSANSALLEMAINQANTGSSL